MPHIVAEMLLWMLLLLVIVLQQVFMAMVHIFKDELGLITTEDVKAFVRALCD